MKSIKVLYSLALALFLVASCAEVSLAQSKKQKIKKQPQVEVPPAWITPAAKGLSSVTAQLKEWWRNFHDPQLQTLVAQALEANADLKIGTARVSEVRALRGVANSVRYPT